MKTIATINFKGGVGKTTVTWCLADILADYGIKAKVLVFDLDAQMSLTQAITLNADTGALQSGFEEWYRNCELKSKTIYDALDKFSTTTPIGHFDFKVGYDFIYKLSHNLHFVPSVEKLYWMELEEFNRDLMKDFIRKMLGKIETTKGMDKYDYVLFDCPPSFTLLSYSVLSCCDLILIPVNPDFFAARGVSLLLNSLKNRMQLNPAPKVGVFLNKAKTYGIGHTKETEFYWGEVVKACKDAVLEHGLDVKTFDTKIPDRADIKTAITTHGVPAVLVQPFKDLWTEITQYLQ